MPMLVIAGYTLFYTTKNDGVAIRGKEDNRNRVFHRNLEYERKESDDRKLRISCHFQINSALCNTFGDI